jgi:hypothetical protein
MRSETAETLKSYGRKEQKLSTKRARPVKPVRAGNLTIRVPDAQKSPKGMGKI